MKELQNSKTNISASRVRNIWTVAAVLLVFVMLSGIIVMNVYLSASKNSNYDTLICITENAPLAAVNSGSTGTATDIFGNVSNNTSEPDKADISQNPNAWSNTAQVDIFKHNDSHVKSDGTGSANNVVAPGTANDYIFSLQNSRDFNVKYTLNITGGNDSDYEIPIQLKILDNHGSSLTGDDWVKLSDFDKVSDIGTISPKSDKQYVIRWKWNFENGSDDYDTYLGNTAVNEEITCHINIGVISEYYGDNTDTDSSKNSTSSYASHSVSSSNDFIKLVTTGDNRNIGTAVFVLIVCVVLAGILLRKNLILHNTEGSDRK